LPFSDFYVEKRFYDQIETSYALLLAPAGEHGELRRIGVADFPVTDDLADEAWDHLEVSIA
jgi:hypothetical protein